MEKAHLRDNELYSWRIAIKSLLNPLFVTATQDNHVSYKRELIELHKKYVITQVDKDGNGIAFVCKTVAHKLAKNFVYGPDPRTKGLFQLNRKPLESVMKDLQQYSNSRRITTTKLALPKFKITMKMHKTRLAGSKLVAPSQAKRAQPYED